MTFTHTHTMGLGYSAGVNSRVWVHAVSQSEVLGQFYMSNSKPFQPNPSCFRCFRSVGKFVPEFRKPRVSGSKLGTTWNYSEQIGSNLTKGDSGMCTAVAHHPFFTYLLPYYLSILVPACFWPIYIHSPHSLFPQSSCLLLAVG